MATHASTTPAAQPLAGVDGDLGWALGVMFRTYVKAAGAALGDVPGGPRGYQVVAAAVQEDAPNQGSLAQHLGIDRTVLTYMLDDLERAGLVERHPDPADRRTRRIVATAEGRRIVTDRQERLRHVERHVLSCLDAAEAETFRALLRRLAAHAGALDPFKNACDVAEEAEKRSW